MFTFALSAEEIRDTVLSCDPAVSETDDETLSAFRRDWDESALTLTGEPTRWRVKALTHEEMVNAERSAGIHRRSELGAKLYQVQLSFDDDDERARWHDDLTLRERKALTEHVLYIDRWMREFVAVGVMVIDGEGNPQPALEAIERIRPAHLQTTVLTELCLRVRMISTMDLEKKT